MKNKYIGIAVVALLIGATPAAAHFGFSGDVSVKMGEQKKDGAAKRWQSPDSRFKAWTMNRGIVGTISAISGKTLTITAYNDTKYTVDADEAKVYEGKETVALSTLMVGDVVFVQGEIKDTTVDASVIVDVKKKEKDDKDKKGEDKPKAPKPADDKKQLGVIGEVTAKSGTTLTILGLDGKTYTVAAVDADVWVKGDKKDVSLDDITLKDKVVIHGDIDDTSVTAEAIAELPGEKIGFFQRFGAFWKGFFFGKGHK